jgi:hypothetical protein
MVSSVSTISPPNHPPIHHPKEVVLLYCGQHANNANDEKEHDPQMERKQ